MNKFWSILGWVVSIVLSIFLTIISIKEREPTFIVNPLKPLIVNKDLLKNHPITVLDTLGQTIDDDISVITFYFFNQGHEAIRKENILEPLYLKISEGRILDYKLIKVSRQVTGLRLDKIDSVRQQIGIDFKILENNDGLTGQLIIAGSRNAEVTFDGTIEGVKSISDSYFSWNKLLLTLGPVIILIIAYFIFMYRGQIYRPYELIIRDEDSPNKKSTIRFTYLKVVLYSFFSFLFLFGISLLISAYIFRGQIGLQVPTEIVP